MSDEELVKKVSPINAILKDVFREEIEKQSRVIKEIFRQTQTELKDKNINEKG